MLKYKFKKILRSNTSKAFLMILPSVLLVSACSFVEPERDNTLYVDELKQNPGLVEGLLLNNYKALPSEYVFSEVATDDAVTNDPNNSYLEIATGGWSALKSPYVGSWKKSYEQVYYANLFLNVYKDVSFSLFSENQHELHKQRLKGEAHGLRAWYQFDLLRNFSGVSESGEMLGFPIVTSDLNAVDQPNLKRNTFDECLMQIVSDCDTAIANLPMVYKNIYKTDYDQTLGMRNKNRMNGLSAMAVKSKATLLAASPAYNPDGEQALWEDAAIAAGNFIDSLGGMDEFSSSALNFWDNEYEKDIIWRHAKVENNNKEKDNYPPSLWGKGQVNPTQNLVDAFPMANGYPVTDSRSGYDPANPYNGRDLRLDLYILRNEGDLKGAIYTYKDAAKDGINKEVNSTRTGYYLKKLLKTTVNLDPNGQVTKAVRFYTLVRATEVFLNYAEAANEAWGPKADPKGYGFSAYDVIAAIRGRAGIAQPDNYLNEVAVSKDKFRELIHNERRIELCFEGYRFWDIRRWNKVELMKQTAKGVVIQKNGDSYSFDYGLKVEDRNYKDHMVYGPIPYNETIKYNNLTQNKGW